MLISWEAGAGFGSEETAIINHRSELLRTGLQVQQQIKDPFEGYRGRSFAPRVTMPHDFQGHLPLWDSGLSGALSFFLKSEFRLWTADDRAELGITFTLSMDEQFHQNYAARP